MLSLITKVFIRSGCDHGLLGSLDLELSFIKHITALSFDPAFFVARFKPFHEFDHIVIHVNSSDSAHFIFIIHKLS